jgi:hypothetical protein
MLEITEEIEGKSCLGEGFKPGVYANGLLTLTTEQDSVELPKALEWVVYHNYKIVGYNCMGDLFIQAPNSSAIGYVWLQYGYGRFIANDPIEWLALIDNEGEDREKFLETSAFDYIYNQNGALPYGSVYTMAPILALGGDASLKGLDRCGKGHLNVYLSIISQTFEPENWGEFA